MADERALVASPLDDPQEVATLGKKFMVVRGPKQYEDAATFLRDVLKPISRRIEEWFQPRVKTAHDAWKQQTEDRRKALQPLEQLEGAIKASMQRWRAEERAREEAKAQKQIEQHPDVPPPAPRSRVPEVEGLAVRETWGYVIEDEAKLPRAYLVPNLPAIKAVVQQLGPAAAATIPGIRVVPVETDAVRART